ncbi:uncharacterized protein KZ484_009960 [Pholidichthys leucotaenia]
MERTMESVRSAFHAQLATVMDSLLAAAVCEIAKIFESSLCEQQTELAHKTEEISILRSKLEKAERRQKVKGGGAEGETAQQQTTAGSGLNVGKEVFHSDPVEGLSQNISNLKEEISGQNEASVKHEHTGSRSGLVSVKVQASEESLANDNQIHTDGLAATQSKTKLSHWDQSSHSTDPRPLQDQASSPFISISESGCCSPRPDPGLSQTGDWLRVLDTSRNGVCSLGSLQADGTSCSDPASSSTSTEAPCFRPSLGSDEGINEDNDNSFPFLTQEPGNQKSHQNLVQDQSVQQDQSQIPTGVSPWRSREDRGGRGPINHIRRVTNFGHRDPLRPQSNSQSLTLRYTNTLSNPPVPDGGNGRPYTCPYCTKCFTYPSHQRRHLLRHTGVRLHPCQFCDKSFLTPSELTVHTRTHTGERPFSCAQCGKRFARSGNLRAHQRDVHLGKRPFSCTECGKRFAHRGNLRVHNHRVHQGDPYYMNDQQEPDIIPNTTLK